VQDSKTKGKLLDLAATTKVPGVREQRPSTGVDRRTMGKRMSSYAEIEMRVVQWAEARQIIPNATSQTQLLKTVSELGELADAIIKRDRPQIIDGLGDVLVTLIVVAALEDVDLVSCLESAYNEIKDRKGTLLPSGVFVKES
jgi:NTP pyrophosphatase (non-canonical NTP hydrolase)